MKKTFWELKENHSSNLSREKIWSSRVYVSYIEEKRDRKLHDPRDWLDYFVDCENESIYRVWNSESKQIKRVAYTIIDDDQSLNDVQNEENINDRTIRRPLKLTENDNSSKSSPEEN